MVAGGDELDGEQWAGCDVGEGLGGVGALRSLSFMGLYGGMMKWAYDDNTGREVGAREEIIIHLEYVSDHSIHQISKISYKSSNILLYPP